MWQAIFNELTAGFTNVDQLIRVAVRLLIAVLMGSLIGFKRERDGKSAGLRTHVIVSLGSALFVLTLAESGGTSGELTRVAQGVATGIGFVGAGCIVKPSDGEPHGSVRGLTTAADIWLTAAVGMAAGMGRPAISLIGMLLAVATLVVPRKKGKTIDPGTKQRESESKTVEDAWDD